jgi:hypothetical protein
MIHISDFPLLSPSATLFFGCYFGPFPPEGLFFGGLVVKFVCVNFCRKAEITYAFDGIKLLTPVFR